MGINTDGEGDRPIRYDDDSLEDATSVAMVVVENETI